jgi:hypothetical protein
MVETRTIVGVASPEVERSSVSEIALAAEPRPDGLVIKALVPAQPIAAPGG